MLVKGMTSHFVMCYDKKKSLDYRSVEDGNATGVFHCNVL